MANFELETPGLRCHNMSGAIRAMRLLLIHCCFKNKQLECGLLKKNDTLQYQHSSRSKNLFFSNATASYNSFVQSCRLYNP